MTEAPAVRDEESKEAYIERATRALVRADWRVRDAHRAAFEAWADHENAIADERARAESSSVA